jgi:hypothetical protein
MKLTRWLLPGFLALLGILAIVSPILAVDQPTDLDIQDVSAYENAREIGDQLYIITYYIDFDDLPEDSAAELFMFRLLDETDDEIIAANPYTFYNRGYGMGVVAFYLDAGDAPDWEGDYTVQIVGNPVGVSWNGTAPSTTTTSIDWTTGDTEDIQEYISAEIAYIAAELEQSWAVEMTTTQLGATVLSDSGRNYFLAVVPYLSEVAPYVMGQYTYTPTWPEESPATDNWGDELESAVDGTIFDLGPIIRAHPSTGLSTGIVKAAIYYTLVVAFFILLLGKHKLSKGTMLLVWPFMVAGIFIGVPLSWTIIVAFLALASTVWVFYKGTG